LRSTRWLVSCIRLLSGWQLPRADLPLRPKQPVYRAVHELSLCGDSAQAKSAFVGKTELLEEMDGSLVACIGVRSDACQFRMNGKCLAKYSSDSLPGEAETSMLLVDTEAEKRDSALGRER